MVVFQAREQMPVNVVRHHHRAMAEESLHLLRGEVLLDEPARIEMPESVEAIARSPGLADDASLDQQRIETPADDVAMALRLAVAVREDQMEPPWIIIPILAPVHFRAGELPFV